MLAVLGCATLNLGSQATVLTTSDEPQFDCKDPDGREYWCYDDDECLEYMKGYAVILRHRIFMQKNYEWYKGVKTHTTHINLWRDHKSMLLLGTLSITPVGNERTVEIYMEMYDIDCNLILKDHKRETSGEKI
jgi:hypothetical protein